MHGTEVVQSREEPGPDPQALLIDLASFDVAIALRLGDQQMAYLSPQPPVQESTPAPELDVLPDLQAGEADAQALEQYIALIENYNWAISLAIYPYRDHEDIQLVRGTAALAIGDAVRSHDKEAGPDFLVHLSEVLDRSMKREYGQPIGPAVPSAAEFDAYVSENYLATLPPLPENRELDQVSVGEAVLVLENAHLVPGMVQEVIDNSDQLPAILNHIPEEEVPVLQKMLDEVVWPDGGTGFRFYLRDEAAGLDTEATYGLEERKRVNDLANDRGEPGDQKEYARLIASGQAERSDIRKLHALGRAPLWVYMRHPQLIANPDAEPEVRVSTADAPDGRVIKLRDSAFIPSATWEALCTNPLYREAYSGDPYAEDLAQKEKLARAIDMALRSGVEEKPQPVTQVKEHPEAHLEPSFIETTFVNSEVSSDAPAVEDMIDETQLPDEKWHTFPKRRS